MESRNSEIKRRKGANKRIKQTERDGEFHIINLAGERRGGGGGGGSFKPPPTTAASIERYSGAQ